MKNLISLLLIVLIFLFSASACEQSSPPSDPPNRIVIDTSEDESSITHSEVYSDVAKAAIAVAEAYLDHTVFIQYDQLSMNRVLRNSPRYEFVTPETASSQRFVYMECGVFVRNVYKNVMGYTAPKAGDILDTAYPNVNGERVFHWIGQDNQSPADEQKALSEMLNILVPGDVIYYNYTSNNHIMLYIGNGEVIHCTYGHNKGGGDYSYSAKTDKEEPKGALLRDDLTKLIEDRDMFNSKNSVCVLRPSEMGYPITHDAEIRTEKLQDIVIFKTSSAPLGISVNPGDIVEFSLEIRNDRNAPVTLVVTEEIPATMDYVSGFDSFENGIASSVITINKYSSETITYTLKVKPDTSPGTMIDCDGTRVEDMYISNIPIYVAKTLSADDCNKITSFVPTGNTTCDKLISDIYQSVGLSPKFEDPKDILSKLFESNSAKDSVKLTSKSDITQAFGLVPWLFGGQNCSNPNFNDAPRIRKLSEHNLIVGDIILYSEEGISRDAHLCIYVGEGKYLGLSGDRTYKLDIDTLLDSLLGQYCFCVLRPSFIA